MQIDLGLTIGLNTTSPNIGAVVSTAFETKWKTTTAAENILLPFTGATNLLIDWGDGSEIETVTTINPQHTYATAGEYVVSCEGTATAYGGTGGTQHKCIDILNFGSLGITSFFRGFYGTALTAVTATDGIDSNVTNLGQMFNLASTMESIDLSNWDFVNVTTMDSTFKSTSNLTEVDLSGANFTSMTTLEALCRSSGITTLNLSNITGCTVLTNMSVLCFNCTSLTTLITTNFNFSNVQNFNVAFNDTSLLDVDISAWDISSATIMTNMFNVSGFSDANYDKALLAWSLLTVQPNVSAKFGTAQYTETAARSILTSAPNNWTIVDGGAA